MSRVLKGMKVVHVDCTCGSAEHTVRFMVDLQETDKWEPELTMDFQLRHWQGFWKRLWAAIGYVFLKKDAQWDCIALDRNEVDQLQTVIREHIFYHDKYKKNVLGICPNCDNKGGVSSCHECGKCASCGEINQHKDDCKLMNMGGIYGLLDRTSGEM